MYFWLFNQTCYSKLNHDRLNDFYFDQNKSNKNEIIKNNEIIELRAISAGSCCQIILVYHIEKEELMAIKKIISFDKEADLMLEREKNNYLQISHPFLPKFYGIIENTNVPVFEYIDGQTLLNIKNFNFSRKEKMTIIFQLLSVMKYLHNNKFVYRELKQGNIIIDRNKNLVLIDFDRMLREDNKDERTRDLAGNYIASEIFLGDITSKSDIYSIGKIIYFILTEDESFFLANPIPNIDISIKNSNTDKFYKYMLKNKNEFAEYIPKNKTITNKRTTEYLVKNNDKII